MTNQISNVPKIRYQIVCLLSNSHFSALILWKLAAFCVERPYSFASRNRSRFAFLEKILSQAKNRVNKRGGLRHLSFFTFLRFLYPALSALPSVLYEAGLSAHPIIDSFE